MTQLHAHNQAEATWVKCLNSVNANPASAEVLLSAGLFALRLHRPKHGVIWLERAASLDSNNHEIQCHLGFAYRMDGKNNEAMRCFERSLTIRPDFAGGLVHRGNLLAQLGKMEQALADFDSALALQPEFSQARARRTAVLQKLGRHQEAQRDAEHHLKSAPNNADVWYNLGTSQFSLDSFVDALKSFDMVTRLAPNNVKAWLSRGITFLKLNRIAEAIESIDRALELQPAHPETNFCKALLLLLIGDFEQGFPLYEYRWKQDGVTRRQFNRPLWLGRESVQGETILLHCEQGLGDTIQFCRYAKKLSQLGARVVLQVQPSLVPFLANLEGVSEVISSDDEIPPFDRHCPLLSLPLALGTGSTTIPSETPYLRVTKDRLANWNARIGHRTRPRIGLVWTGNAGFPNDRHRSLVLADLLARLPNEYEYFSLQKEVRAGDMNALARLRHYGPHLQDFADTAALCELMDLIVSVDTSVAHLAGALGRPTYLLLPHSPDWRWQLNRADSPWYPTMRLFRQDKPGQWGGAIDELTSQIVNGNFG